MALEDEIRAVLSDPTRLPPEFLRYMVQHGAQNPVSVQSLNAPTVIASGVGSTANAPTRYVGGTVAGAPSAGTYVVGDFVVSHDGKMYVCTATGTPGTWTTWLAQGDLTYNKISSTVNVTGTSSGSPTTIIAGTSAVYSGQDIYIEAYTVGIKTPSDAGSSVSLLVMEDGSAIGTIAQVITPAAAFMVVPFYGQVKRTPSAGSHTYGLSAWASTTTGTPQIISGPGGGGSFNLSTFVRTRYA